MLGIRVFYQPPEQLILAKLRMTKATFPHERSVKDKNDIIAILSNTRVNMGRIRRGARKENTLEIFENISQSIKHQ